MTEKPTAVPRRGRILLIIIVTLLAASALIFGMRTIPSRWLSVPGFTAEPLAVTVVNMPAVSPDPVISIQGGTTRPSYVELYVGEQLVGKAVTSRREFWSFGRQYTEANGFNFPQVPLRPGANELHFRAELLGGQAEEPATLSRSVEWKPYRNVRPSLWRTPSRVKTPQVKVAGTAYPGRQLILTVLDDAEGEEPPKNVRQEVTAAADENGYFEADVTLPSPGSFYIFPHYEPDDRLLDLNKGASITFDPLASRKAVATVSYDDINLDVEITLSKESPAVAGLLSGRKSLAKFIDEQLDLHISGSTAAFNFREAKPEISISDSATTVRARGVSPRSDILPVLNGALTFTRGYEGRYPLEGDGDSLAVKVEHFTVKAYNPPPASLNEGVAVWAGGRDGGDRWEVVQVGLGYNPLGSPGSLLRFLSLSPYEIFNWRISSLISLEFAFLYSVPIIWMLWLLKKHAGQFWAGPQEVKRLRRQGVWLLALTLVPSLQATSYPIAKMLYDRRPAWSISYVGHSDHPVLLFIGGAAALVAVVLLYGLVRAVSDRPAVDGWLKSLQGGYALAFVIYAALCGVTFGVMHALSQDDEWLSPTTLAALPVILLLLVWGRRLYEFARPQAEGRGRSLLVLLLALALAYPINRNIYSLDVYKFPTWEVTQANLSYFFNVIQGTTPFLFFLSILPFLKRGPDEEDDHPLVASLGLVIFSAYLVGTTASWFIVPLPFILALKLYPKLVRGEELPTPTRRRVKALVFSGRAALLNKVFRHYQAQQFLIALDQVRKKVASGDLTVEQFVERKAEIEGYESEAKLDNKVEGGLNAKDVVLNFGPYQSSWENGVHAVKYGLLIALPFLLVFGTLLLRQVRPDSPFLPLWVSARLFSFVMGWVVSAFFFGYFFARLRGETGLKKGLNTAVVIIICFTPVWLMSGLSPVELSATFLRAGQIFLFFTLLGVGAFDYFTFRRVLREGFSLRKFTQFGDMPSLTAVVSVLLTSGGVAVSTALSGQFTTLVTQMVGVIFPQLPAQLPK